MPYYERTFEDAALYAEHIARMCMLRVSIITTWDVLIGVTGCSVDLIWSP